MIDLEDIQYHTHTKKKIKKFYSTFHCCQAGTSYINLNYTKKPKAGVFFHQIELKDRYTNHWVLKRQLEESCISHIPPHGFNLGSMFLILNFFFFFFTMPVNENYKCQIARYIYIHLSTFFWWEHLCCFLIKKLLAVLMPSFNNLNCNNCNNSLLITQQLWAATVFIFTGIHTATK